MDGRILENEEVDYGVRYLKTMFERIESGAAARD